MNYTKTMMLLAGLTALFMGVGWLIGGMGGALIALVLMAMLGAPVMALHALGVSLTVARGIHGYGVATQDGPNIGRFLGALFTLIIYAVLGVGLVLHAVTG